MEENGLEDKITVLGQLSDVQMKEAYLNSHVSSSVPPRWKIHPIPGEAMLLGFLRRLPDGGIPDMAEDQRSALLFEKGNVHELAHCGSGYLKMTGWRTAFPGSGEAGRT